MNTFKFAALVVSSAVMLSAAALSKEAVYAQCGMPYGDYPRHSYESFKKTVTNGFGLYVNVMHSGDAIIATSPGVVFGILGPGGHSTTEIMEMNLNRDVIDDEDSEVVSPCRFEKVLKLVGEKHPLIVCLTTGEASVPVIAKFMEKGNFHSTSNLIFCSGHENTTYDLMTTMPKYRRWLQVETRHETKRGVFYDSAEKVIKMLKHVKAEGVILTYHGEKTDKVFIGKIRKAGFRIALCGAEVTRLTIEENQAEFVVASDPEKMVK